MVLEDGFYFDPTRHDATSKKVLGERFEPGNGVKEGEKVIELLAKHPSTARFIAKKLAQYFIIENPPQTLIEGMAEAFLTSNGNIPTVIKVMLESPDFWVKPDEDQKIKSPFEFIVSSARALNLDVKDPIELLRWCTKMGQPLYAYQAPTGYPDQAAFWVNGTSLIKRMDFALQLANNEINGVYYHTNTLTKNNDYLQELIPTRNIEPILNLVNNIDDPNLRIGILLGSPIFQYQ